MTEIKPPLIALEHDGSKWVQLEDYQNLKERCEYLESQLERKANLSPPPTSDTVRGGGWRR